MSTQSAGLTDDNATYTFRPSLLGAPWEFKLTDDAIAWVAGSKSGHVPFRNVRRLRMSYRPANMQAHRFMTELWADGAPKLRIVSSSWKSAVVQERLDKPYSAFVTELHWRIARAGGATILERGGNRMIYWPGLIVFAGVTLASALLIVRALQTDAMGGAAFIGGFCLLFLWQGGNFFRRNWPGVYRPDVLPAELMPKA
jgi:hypothetical protein